MILNEKNKEKEIDELFLFWRKHGFPTYEKNQYDHEKELLKIVKFDDRKILNGKDLKQTMHGCGFLWTYFPHWVSVRCGNDKSVIENWNEDEKLKTLIRKTYDYEMKHNGGRFTVNRLRQNAKVYCSKQSVSNFRPTVAKYIYNTYGNNGVVWDMSGGFGGRLLGFIASNCKHYIATEPSTLTYEGLLQMKNDYCYVGKKVEILKMGSEDFLPQKESLDLCFTSPPYFDTEKYSDESSQSFIKFDTKETWLNGFLRQTIKNCFYGLKENGYMIINIANVKSFQNLEEETIKLAKDVGFELKETLYLTLSSIAGKGTKREPVFVFKKRKSYDRGNE
jgi:hypothetical protein